VTALRILHISDLHARGPREAKGVWQRVDVLGDPWRRNLDDLAADGRPFDIVAFTGDIADWGLAEEYARATPFVAEVLERLQVPRERLFVVPGNHDINRKLKKNAWAKLREGIFSLPRKISVWMADDRKPPPVGFRKSWRDDVLERQGAFWTWVEQDLGRGDLLPRNSPHGRLGYRASASAGGQPVHIIGLDTAWLAGDDGDAGRLWLTDDQIGLLSHDAQGLPLPGFRLALMHHPLSDLADAVKAGRLLTDSVDLVLRGHQHTPVVRTQNDPDRTYRELAAGCLYEGDEGNSFANTCQVIDVALDHEGRPQRYDIRFRAWSPRGGFWHDDSSLYSDATGGRLTWEHERPAGAGPVTPAASVSVPAAIATAQPPITTLPPPTATTQPPITTLPPRRELDDHEPVGVPGGRFVSAPAAAAVPPSITTLPPPTTATGGRTRYATPASGLIVVYRCMAQAPQGFVERRQLTEVVELLEQTAASPSAVTVALRGSGGFGKTTLAQALCMDERVQRAYPDGILWTTLGEHLSEAERLGRVLDLLRWWTGEEVPSFTDTSAASAELRQRLAGQRVLLVVDDVWQSADLAPFLGMGPGAAVLVTTRDRRTLPPGCEQIEVDAMHQAESLRLLGAGLEVTLPALSGLAERLGHWPLLLGLVNRQLRELVEEQGLDVAEAIGEVERLLAEEGLTAFDVEDDRARRTAVERTMAVSLQRLDEEAQQAYERLAAFPEDADVPLALLQRFWGLDAAGVRKLCARLQALSLLLRFDLATRSIRIHDVFRQYLIDRQGDRLPALHREWLAVFRPASGHWSDLPADEPYAWRYLAYHLRHAGRADELAGLLFDFDWLAAKLSTTGLIDLLADFEALAPGHADSRDARLLHDAIRLSSKVIERDRTQLPGQLLGRLTEPGGAGPGGAGPGPGSHAGQGRMARLLARARGPHGFRWLRPRAASLTPPGGPLLRTLAGHAENVWAVAVTPDGAHTVSASQDGTLKLWDLDRGTEIRTLSGHAGWVRDVAVTSDGARVVSASEDRTLKLWDLDQGAEIRTLTGHDNVVLTVAVTPDGQRAISGSHDKTLRLWDLDRGVVIHTFTGHAKSVRSVAVTPDGKRAVSASEDHTLKLWDLERGTEIHTFTGHARGVRAVAVTPDGKRAVSASEDRTLKLWDLEAGVELQTLTGHDREVLAVAVSPDGARALSASADGTLMLWDLDRGVRLRTVARHSAVIWTVAITPDGARAVSASADATIQLWDLALGGESRPLAGHAAGIQAVAITPDGARALSAARDQTLRLWNLERGTEALTMTAPSENVRAVAVTPDGKHAVSASDKLLELWDLERGDRALTMSGHDKVVLAVAVTPDGKRAVSASEDETIKLWDLEAGVEIVTMTGHRFSVWGVAVTPDGRRLVSASADGSLILWDLEHGAEIGPLGQHGLPVRAVAVTPDGKRAISASADKTLKVWDLERYGELRTLAGHGAGIRAVAVTPDGKRVLSASLDQTLRLWDLESGQVLATFTADGALDACAVAPTGKVFVAGDRNGRLHVLELVEPA
jgi:WD40 repeat protein/predicted MPP superfamily phosphohydrolase